MNRDSRWENVWAYSGPIRNFNPEHWNFLKEDEIYEFYIEVTVKGKVYSRRYVEEVCEIEYSRNNNLGLEKEILDRLVEQVDRLMWRIYAVSI